MSFFQNLFSSPGAMLKVAIGLCYIILGVYVYINRDILWMIDVPYRRVLPVLVMAYGTYRLVRAVTDLRNE
jgi:hypothetical protein